MMEMMLGEGRAGAGSHNSTEHAVMVTKKKQRKRLEKGQVEGEEGLLRITDLSRGG
jgi:hypothetical protein